MTRGNVHAITVTMCTFYTLLFKKKLSFIRISTEVHISIAETPHTQLRLTSEKW